MRFLIYVVALLLCATLANANSDRVLIAKGFKEGKPFSFQAREIAAKDFMGRSVLLRLDAADAFEDMMVHAAKDGFFLGINYGFRTYAQQNFWYKKFQKRCEWDERFCNMAARPGFSTHQEGKSVDISGCIRYFTQTEVNKLKPKARKNIATSCTELPDGRFMCKTILFWWLNRNAPEYGFHNDVEDEPWHWTYYGEEEIAVGG